MINSPHEHLRADLGQTNSILAVATTNAIAPEGKEFYKIQGVGTASTAFQHLTAATGAFCIATTAHAGTTGNNAVTSSNLQIGGVTGGIAEIFGRWTSFTLASGSGAAIAYYA